jgi:RNA polymerase sigma factor (sigma-70 family)
MKIQKKSRIKENICLVEGKQKTSFYATAFGINKAFDTLECAEDWVAFQKSQRKRTGFLFPNDLIIELFGGCETIDINYLEKHIEEDLNVALEYIKEIYADIFKMYYVQGYTLESIGLQKGITRERVRQIISKVMAKLRYPSLLSIVRYGKETLKLKDDIARLQDDLLKKKMELINQLESKEPIVLTPEDIKKSIYDKPIEYLCLSVRCYNGLMRAGIKKVGDLVVKTKWQIRAMRNIGAKSESEIHEALIKIGLSFRNEENEDEPNVLTPEDIKKSIHDEPIEGLRLPVED